MYLVAGIKILNDLGGRENFQPSFLSGIYPNYSSSFDQFIPDVTEVGQL